MKYTFTLLFLCCCIIATAQSSPGDYIFSNATNATLYNMANADTLIYGRQDNIADDARRLPFVFAAMGNFHQTFSVNTNGEVYLSPQGGNNNYYRVVPLKVTGGNNDEWDGSGMGTSKNGAIICKTFGITPNRQFVISFEKMSLSKRMGNEDATFQVALHESSGIIQFIYGAVNVSDTLQSFYDPMISYLNDYHIVNTTTHSSYTTTNAPWGANKNPGIVTGLHSPVNGSNRTYLFTPPSIPDFIDTQLVFNSAVSGIALMTIPEFSNTYMYYLQVSKSPSGPFGAPSVLTSNQLTGIPDSTFYCRVYRSNGAAIATNFASGVVTYGSPRKFTSQTNGFWGSNITWGKPAGITPHWGDTVIIAQGDTVKLDNFLAASAMEMEVAGVLDYANALNPLLVRNMNVTATGLVKVHNGSVASSPASINGKTLTVLGNLTGAGKLDMRYHNCRLHIKNADQAATHLINVNFEQGNNNTPLLNSLTLSTYNPVQLMTPVTINTEIIGEYGSLVTNNNLTIDKNATVATQSAPSQMKIYRYSRNQLFTGAVNYAPGTSPHLYYMGTFRYYDVTAPFVVPPYQAGNEVPATDSVERLYIYSNAGVDFADPVTVTNTMEWENGHVNMINNDDFIFSGTGYYYYSGGIRTDGWVKLLQYQNSFTGTMNTPGNSSVYPIFSNGVRRFAFLQGALAATGLYGVKHTGSNGTTPFTVPFSENGTTFGKRSNSYWEISSPTGTEFQNNAFHFIAGDMDSISDAQLTNICFVNGAAAGAHLSTNGGQSTFITGRTALNSSLIAVNQFHVGIAQPNPLSAGLLSLAGVPKRAQVFLEWKLGDVIGPVEMSLERSKDGTQFESINLQRAESSQIRYVYTDNQPILGANFYRVRMVAANGIERYSNTVSVIVDDAHEALYCYPNPARSEINIIYKNLHLQEYSIYDMTGFQRTKGKLKISNGFPSIHIANLPVGIYLLKLYAGNNIYSVLFLKE